MRMRYILLKETPELKKGAILKEDCDDGTQGFHCVTPEKEKFNGDGTAYSRATVVNQPEWFQKVDVVYIARKAINKLGKKLFHIQTEEESESDA